jgi:hypothetical protein
MANLRESSEREWESSQSTEHINAGSLQRIADATEAMAENYIELQNDRDRNFRWYKNEHELRRKLERQNSSLRGVITRLKKKVQA